jgi:adenosylmethionine-8-amino-7-oxononanoate aminotransferase
MDQGVFLRPLGNTIYLLPPFTIAEQELTLLYSSILNCLEMLSHE